MLRQRLLFGSLLIGGVGGLVWADLQWAATRWPSGSAIPVAIAILALWGAVELLRLVRQAGYRPLGPAVLATVALSHAALIVRPQWPIDGVLLVGIAFGVIAIGQVLRRRTAGGIGDIATSMAVFIYMGVLPGFLTLLRGSMPGTAGTWAVVWVVAVVKGTDIGAYFVGMALGRHKLIPGISPAKTIEGLIGGLSAAAAIGIGARALVLDPAAPHGLVGLGLLAAGLGAIGQFGDLTESVFKRDAATKDSGQVIPAFGGIMDLLDSPALAAPFALVAFQTWLA